MAADTSRYVHINFGNFVSAQPKQRKTRFNTAFDFRGDYAYTLDFYAGSDYMVRNTAFFSGYEHRLRAYKKIY